VNLVFNSNDALLVVDIQYDFLPNGALHVPAGDQVIPVTNRLIEAANQAKALIIASRDWHPTNHSSFQAFGGPWPPHCVQESPGAKFHADVRFPPHTLIISKATEPDQEAYSAFAGQTADGQALVDILQQHHIKRVIICGLALDYCVKASSLDAIKQGFETVIIESATRAINQEDGQEAIRVLKSFGAQII